MKAVDLAQAIHEFRRMQMLNGFANLYSDAAKGIVIGLEAFSDIMHDPTSYKYVNRVDDTFKFTFKGIPMYRTDDMDVKKFEIF